MMGITFHDERLIGRIENATVDRNGSGSGNIVTGEHTHNHTGTCTDAHSLLGLGAQWVLKRVKRLQIFVVDQT
jgi:hypothetical protein